MKKDIKITNKTYVMKFLAYALVFTVTAAVVAVITSNQYGDVVSVVTEIDTKPTIIVIDPGHGGEDPGASSESGINEKDLNLQISLLCSTLLEAQGTDVRLTRTDDRMVYDMYDDLEDYGGKKKTYDLKNRIRYADDCSADLLVSIHMNKFFQPQYGGLQVYYSPNDQSSKDFASAVQRSVKEFIDPNNERQIKEANSSIYLLDNTQRSAIMVECGFLSNAKDLNDLTDPKYQLDLSAAIISSITNSFDNVKESAS